MTRRLCSKPPGSRPRDGHSCRNMFQRPYSPDKIYQVLSFYIPYQHILNYLRTITLAYIFLYRTSAHYKSDALLRTARASCSTPASAYITLINRNTNRRPVVRFTSTRRPTRPSVPPYSTTDDSPVHPGHRFMRPRRFTTRRTTCSSAPVYNTAAGSSVCSSGRLGRD